MGTPVQGRGTRRCGDGSEGMARLRQRKVGEEGCFFLRNIQMSTPHLYGSHPRCQQRVEQGPQHQPLEATSVCKGRVKAPPSCSVSCCGLQWRSGEGLVVCESLGTRLPLFSGQVGNCLPDSWLLATFHFSKARSGALCYTQSLTGGASQPERNAHL